LGRPSIRRTSWGQTREIGKFHKYQIEFPMSLVRPQGCPRPLNYRRGRSNAWRGRDQGTFQLSTTVDNWNVPFPTLCRLAPLPFLGSVATSVATKFGPPLKRPEASLREPRPVPYRPPFVAQSGAPARSPWVSARTLMIPVPRS
jgi:hypothetical protein